MDFGGEFINRKFSKMAKQLAINVKPTAVEFIWSNGVVERHILVSDDMFNKIMAENNTNLKIAIA